MSSTRDRDRRTQGSRRQGRPSGRSGSQRVQSRSLNGVGSHDTGYTLHHPNYSGRSGQQVRRLRMRVKRSPRSLALLIVVACVALLAIFGISSCARYDGHVCADLLPNMLKGKAKQVQQLVVCLISLALSVYMTVISIQFTITQFEGGNTSIAIAIPIWVIYLSTCIGFFLMSYVYLRILGILLKKKAAQETGEEEAAC